MKITKYAIIDGYRITIDPAYIFGKTVSQPDGFYVNDMLADATELPIIKTQYEEIIVNTDITIIELARELPKKGKKGKYIIKDLPKLGKTFATNLGDEALVFVRENDEWLFVAIGIRERFLQIMHDAGYTVHMISPVLLSLFSAKQNLYMRVNTDSFVVINEDESEWLFGGIIDITKRLKLLGEKS